MAFHKLYIRDSKHEIEGQGSKMRHVLHVNDPHALIQASGYLKYVNSGAGPVFFRGQSKFYPTLEPSLFRGLKTQKALDNQKARIRSGLTAIIERNTTIKKKINSKVVEPLLQHYGLRTSWIDLVDNVWVALWFACHKAIATGEFSEYLHFERRSPAKEPDGSCAYILMIGCDGKKTDVPGVWSGDSTELVDLRVSCPSIFVRPHAQHGVLFRMKSNGTMLHRDYSTKILGVLRIRLVDALSWLGIGEMLSVHSLFPPPSYDDGYAMLLASKFQGNKHVGSIAHIGA